MYAFFSVSFQVCIVIQMEIAVIHFRLKVFELIHAVRRTIGILFIRQTRNPRVSWNF